MTLFYCLIFFSLSASNAYCYIDPGTGSYAFQIVIAGVTGLIFYLSLIRRKVIAFFLYLIKRFRG